MKSKSSQLVSIIIPTYNHASYLDRALRCVLDQTYENWEAIVIDNYSTDNTQEIISKYKDKRVKYLKIRNNGIIAKSRNKGILASKGNWIAFLDSDDWWIPRKLELCMKYINNNDLIYHDLKIKYSNRRNLLNRIVKTRKLKKPILIDLLVNGNAICNSSVIVKKQKLDDINSERIVGQQISNMKTNKRLKFAIVNKGHILGNSCNYLIVKQNQYGLSNKALLAQLNSDIINWYFKSKSSNNHISNFEIGNFPLILDKSINSKLESLILSILPPLTPNLFFSNSLMFASWFSFKLKAK